MKTCTCGTRFYPQHNPTCQRHPIPVDGSPCDCCGMQMGWLTTADQAKVRARAASLPTTGGESDGV
jgi:hypothetical protein